ncbi:MAG: N-acetyltransferase [Cyanobacteria bacterium J06554_3]
MAIRQATRQDKDGIYQVHWSAFSESERSLVSQLAVDLLLEDIVPKPLSLVAEREGDIVGHVAFSSVTLEHDSDFQGFILTPLGVVPSWQGKGIGTQLVKLGMQHLSERGVDSLLVYGDPNYYGRFGFSAVAAECFVSPYQLQYPFGWQAIDLRDCTKVSAKVKVVSSLQNPALW